MSDIAIICGVFAICVLSGLGIMLFAIRLDSNKKKKVCKDFYEDKT